MNMNKGNGVSISIHWLQQKYHNNVNNRGSWSWLYDTIPKLSFQFFYKSKTVPKN